MMILSCQSLGGVRRGGWGATLSNLLNSFGAVVQCHQVAPLHIKAIEIFHCILGVEDVLVDDERRSLLFCSFAFPDLPDRPEPAEYIVQLFCSDLVR